MASTAKTALLGVGLMGRPMAQNLARGDVPLSVWNRSADKCAGLEVDGIRIAESAIDAISDADFVISMVADGKVSLALVRECLASLKPGAIWIDMSSTKPADARAIADVLKATGIGFLDAPVSGGTKGAEAATLAIMVGGEVESFAHAEGVLQTMGRPVLVGPTGAGQLSKLANQAIVASTIGAVAEAMLLLEQGGADPAAVRAALKGGFADSVILQQHGERMTTGNFVPGGLSKFQVKDLLNVMEEAQGMSLSLPITEQMLERFTHYVDAMDGADRDHSGLFEELKQRNGLL